MLEDLIAKLFFWLMRFIIWLYPDLLNKSYNVLKKLNDAVTEVPSNENSIIQLGDYVIDKEDVNITDPAIVVIDHADFGYPNLYSIKRVSDGHLSLRDTDQLTKLTPLQFCKKWCEHQIEYPKDKENTCAIS